jgi:hypothetical protein
MQSTFTELEEKDKRLLIAKIIHNINYSQSSFETILALVRMWDEYPRKQANFFTQFNTLTNGTTKN